MGRDKAGLPAPPYRTLLERQLAVLAALAPCERLISARGDQTLPALAGGSNLAVVLDDGSAGPLGGLVALLRAARAPRVLVLGVDLARINVTLLRRILGVAPDGDEDIGVIPRTTVAPQPLAALWPRAILPLAEAQLAEQRDLSLRTLIRHGEAAGLIRWFDVPSWDEARFANWNHPSDIPAPAHLL